MAKAKTATDEFQPAPGFAPAAEFEPPRAAEIGSDGPDPRDAEIERLRAELAAARAHGPVYAPGRRYRVELPDVPGHVVVEPAGGEHPFEAYKRAAGVIASPHAPQITETEEPAGVYGPDGKPRYKRG
jgi:hypothetical protein